MVLHVDLPAAFRQLAALRRRIRELVEWAQLAHQERHRHLAPGFDPAASALRDICQDLRDVHHLFLSLASDVRSVLNRSDLVCTTTDRTHWQRRLAQLERDVAELAVAERFLNE